MIYLLDTDTFTLAHRGRQVVVDRIEAVEAPSGVRVPIVTWIEVLRGRMDALIKADLGPAIIRAQELLRSSQRYLSQFAIMPFDTTSTAEFDRLHRDKSAKKIGRADLLIACIALANDATLVTRNTKDFQNIPGLKLENWAD